MTTGGFKYTCPSCGHGFDDDRIEDRKEREEEREEEHDRVFIKRSLRLIHTVQTKIEKTLTKMERTQEKIMGNQANLDADVEKLNTGIAAVAQEIADLKAQNPSLDLSGLENSLVNFATLLPDDVNVPPTA